MKRLLEGLSLSILVLLIGACSLGGSSVPVRIDEVRKEPVNFKIVTFNIQRGDLIAALKRGEKVNSVRLVPIFGTTLTTGAKEYRLFDIQNSSSYKLLGLKNGDILISAHGYIIQEPRKFAEYVSVIPNQNETHIEIKRGEQLYTFKYNLLPALNIKN